MAKNPLIKVFDKAETKDCLPGSAQIVELEIDIAGEMIQFQIHVLDGHMTLADIVPLAQTVAEKIIDVTVVKTERWECNFLRAGMLSLLQLSGSTVSS